MRANEFITEVTSYQPPKLNVGDKILKGKFKNTSAEIKGFTKDKHNQPVLKTNKGDVQLFKPRVAKLIKEDATPSMSSEDMIAYLRQHHDTNLHQDYLDHINTFSKFVLTDIPVNTIKTDLPKLDRAKVEQYKKMDFSKAPPIVMGGGYILDGYHRANVAKALGMPTIKGYVGVKSVAEGSEQSLSSMVNQDQTERNEYANFVKSQAGGDWDKGAKMYAQLKKRPSTDVFGDASRLNQFMKMKFDFDKFTDEDWNNYWLLAQHCDTNRDFQKNALSIIRKYQGTDNSHYKYLYDRISMGLTGKQKYGTQNVKEQGVAEEGEPIKVSNDREKANAWIEKVYTKYPYTMQNNHVMTWGSGDEQQFAMFELTPSFSKRGAVEVKWIQAYPLRQGVGSRAMQELQSLAREDGISLTLFPWDKGQVSQSKLTKFYKGQGFAPTVKGGKAMQWEPK